MTDTFSSTLAQDYAAALDWWREAGVDHSYDDEPHGWLKAPEVAAAPPPSPPPRTLLRKEDRREREQAPLPDLGGDPAQWPGDLAAFRTFWLTDPSLDDGPVGDRVAPEGPGKAALMILVPLPLEPVDERLLARILAAMGQDAGAVYRAALLPRHSDVPDWEGSAARGLGALTRHHIALAAPGRLITFGKQAATFAADSGVASLAAPSLEMLARSAGHKRRFWNAWLEWNA